MKKIKLYLFKELYRNFWNQIIILYKKFRPNVQIYHFLNIYSGITKFDSDFMQNSSRWLHQLHELLSSPLPICFFPREIWLIYFLLNFHQLTVHVVHLDGFALVLCFRFVLFCFCLVFFVFLFFLFCFVFVFVFLFFCFVFLFYVFFLIKILREWPVSRLISRYFFLDQIDLFNHASQIYKWPSFLQSKSLNILFVTIVIVKLCSKKGHLYFSFFPNTVYFCYFFFKYTWIFLIYLSVMSNEKY